MKYCVGGKFCFRKIDEFLASSSFGVTSTIFNSSRSTVVIATSPLHLLKISGSDYKKYFEYRVKDIIDRMHFMERIIFRISRPLTARFCNLFQEKEFSKGEIIYSEGSAISALYIIKEGEVQVNKKTLHHLIFHTMKLFQDNYLKKHDRLDNPSARPASAYKKIRKNVNFLVLIWVLTTTS